MFPQYDEFLAQLSCQGESLYKQYTALPSLAFSSLDPQRTALIVVDVIEGFAYTGAMASPRVAALVEPVADMIHRCARLGMSIVTVADTHTTNSIELQTYPQHCLCDTVESQLCPAVAQAVSDLPARQYTHICKNSTNAFVDPAFTAWREAHPDCDTYVVVGDCTDICVMHFAFTAKTWHNAQDKPLRLMVPVSLVDTYDAPGHPAAVANAMALWFMQGNGIELYGDVTA